MTKLDIAQAHLIERFDFIIYGRDGLEKFASLLHRHVEYVGNALALVFNLQRFAVISSASAHLTGHENVGQEMHFNLNNTVTETVLASAARYVEREPACLVAPFLRVGSHGKKVADCVEYARIRCRVASRCSANRRLVNRDDFIEILDSLRAVVFPKRVLCAVVGICEHRINDFVDKARFTAARNPCDRRNQPNGNVHVNIF